MSAQVPSICYKLTWRASLRHIDGFSGEVQCDATFLFRSGDPDAVDEACKRATVGKLLPNAL